MLRREPIYIANADIIGVPIKFKWNLDVSADLMERENTRLKNAIDKACFKANMALSVALTEWIVWRLEGLGDTADAHHRIEAGWTGVVSPAYVRSFAFELSDDDDIDDNNPIAGLLEATLYKLAEVFQKYSSFDGTMDESVITLALLARHVAPNKKVFDDWLSNNLRRLSTSFPFDLSYYDRSTKTYDASYEKPVPREFFDPNFVYDDAVVREALSAFLGSLDPKKNHYLQTPEDMKKQGFDGIPYAL